MKLATTAATATGITAGTDNVSKFCTTTNGHTFIKEIQVECNGITVYNNTVANETSDLLQLLNYTKIYADSVGKDQFFYLNTSTGTAEPRSAQALYNKGFAKRKTLTDAAAVNKISIPLNLFSFFASFKNNIHPNIKMSIILGLENDIKIILRHTNAADSKVILTKIRLWCPKIILNGPGMKLYAENYLKPKAWPYLRDHHERKQTESLNDFFRISTGIRRPRHVFIWYFDTSKYSSHITFSLLSLFSSVIIIEISPKHKWK